MENYTDQDKLKKNIFQDFEKQESWQSYTTLLFADIKPNSETNEKEGNKKSKHS